MTWGQEVCYASLYSEPASALGLPTVWSPWRNPRMAKCQEVSTLLAGYIPHHKVTSASNSGSLDFIVCVWNVVGWLIVYQDDDYLYPGQSVRPSVDCRLDDTTFGAWTFSWQEQVCSWKAGPGETMTVENLQISGINRKCLKQNRLKAAWSYWLKGNWSIRK